MMQAVWLFLPLGSNNLFDGKSSQNKSTRLLFPRLWFATISFTFLSLLIKPVQGIPNAIQTIPNTFDTKIHRHRFIHNQAIGSAVLTDHSVSWDEHEKFNHSFLECFQVKQPVILPVIGDIVHEDLDKVEDKYSPCTVTLMEHNFGNSYGKPFIGMKHKLNSKLQNNFIIPHFEYQRAYSCPQVTIHHRHVHSIVSLSISLLSQQADSMTALLLCIWAM